MLIEHFTGDFIKENKETNSIENEEEVLNN